MNKYSYIHFFWLLPAYFVVQFGYQTLNYYSVQNTYAHGESYVASVVDFDVKQIAAQTNGYVVVRFTDSEGTEVQQKLSLPVQFAQVIMDSEMLPVRYLPSSFREIVIMPVYELQKKVILVNISVALLSLLATGIVAFYASRYARRKVKYGEDTIRYERVDT